MHATSPLHASVRELGRLAFQNLPLAVRLKNRSREKIERALSTFLIAPAMPAWGVTCEFRLNRLGFSLFCMEPLKLSKNMQ
jgi:hypothetical protein